MRKTLMEDHEARVEAHDEKQREADEAERGAQLRRIVFLLHSEKRPRTAEWMALETGIPLERVVAILDELEQDGAVQSAGGNEEESA